MTEHSASFTVFPAIDLRAGQVVRLQEGDPARQTRYSADPAAAARRWIEAGARWLHVVNLDGAFDQEDNANQAALRAIIAETSRADRRVRVQFGGGLRSIEAIRQALDLGVQRAIIGTAAVEQPEVLAGALVEWGAERIGASLDARDGFVQVRGWTSPTPLLASDVAAALRRDGLRWLVFTDIARDGLQTGLNLPATVQLAQSSGLSVIASGGVSSLDDVVQARKAGLAGVIVGKALYEGALDPVELLALSSSD